ncbi:MAG: ABC transporter substrate-binding protein [Vicinamibacterales bacterium]
MAARTTGAALALVLAFVASGCAGERQTRDIELRDVTDMTGRTVRVPRTIRSIATLGAVPVINGFLFAFDAGLMIVNGLPTFARSPRFKYQTVFAPTLASRPIMQGSGREPDLERLNTAAPDLALTMDRETADILARGSSIPTVVLAWRQPDDVESVMRLLGEVFDKPDVARDYVEYFESTVSRVKTMVSGIPVASRPRVLYCTLRRLTQEQPISEWWIATAGGRSVTDASRTTESFSFTLEQLFAWDPDILILSSADDLRELKADARYATLKAVRTNAVFVAPTGAHQWANRTIEQPLTLLWAVSRFYPERAAGIDMIGEMQAFYRRFFHVTIDAAQAREILDAAL